LAGETLKKSTVTAIQQRQKRNPSRWTRFRPTTIAVGSSSDQGKNSPGMTVR
jgi:hypothetical protein